MKKTIDFKTNFNEISEEEIDDVLNTGTLLYSSESYSENHPFISPKMTTSVYKFKKYTLFIEVLNVDDGLCKTFVCIREEKPRQRKNNTIKIIMDKDSSIKGYCTSSEMVDKFLSDTIQSLMVVKDVDCVDNTIYESSMRVKSDITYTFTENNEWVGNYPEKCRQFDYDDDNYYSSYYIGKKYPYIEVDMEGDELSIIIHTITKKNDDETIKEAADKIFNSLLETYPLFKDGNCNLNNIKLFNMYLKEEYEKTNNS